MILNSLLKKVYRSIDFREEEDVYDRLEVSVSGDLLADIYLQNRKARCGICDVRCQIAN